MIDKAGYFDWALQDPGPVGSVNGRWNGGKGVVPHSAEGHFASLEALHDFHWARATAPPGQRASWAATNLQDGRFVQHYSIHAQTWTSGATYPNDNFFAFENEGLASEPLTPAQVDNIVRVIRELSALQGWKPERPIDMNDHNASLYEHNECTRWGAAATACPSGRIPWQQILAELEERMPMPEYVELKQADHDITVVIAKMGNDLGAKIDALETSTRFLIKVVNNLAARVDDLEHHTHAVAGQPGLASPPELPPTP